jgi:hypothetical protein
MNIRIRSGHMNILVCVNVGLKSCPIVSKPSNSFPVSDFITSNISRGSLGH